MTQEIDRENLLELYRTIVVARAIDAAEKRYVASGQAFFHISGTGHEGSCALVPVLLPADWVFCHYRAKALMIARGASVRTLFDGFFASDQSPSGGRLLSGHLHDTQLHLFSSLGPVANSALHATGIASVIRSRPEAPIVVCGMGDGTTQQGEVYEAISEAVRSALPVLFLVEDNRYAISTPTAGRTFYSLPSGEAREFLGIPITRCDGSSIIRCTVVFHAVVSQMREMRRPAIVVLQTERLDSHSNADDQSVYRDGQEIEQARRRSDALAVFEAELLGLGVKPALLAQIREQAQAQVTEAARDARVGASQPSARKVDETIRTAGWQDRLPAEHSRSGQAASVTMREAIREALRHNLEQKPELLLYGQDICDPKGDVFGVTRGLSSQFPRQVENAPLSEATILGMSIGRAMAGKHPVAMLQFADYLPLAFNQLTQELAPFLWRSKEQHAAPVTVMAPCGAYREGLGPYHSQTFDSILAHVPGLVVAIPSNAEDAAGLLNTALVAREPVVFLYPKSLLNDPVAAAPCAPQNVVVPFGRARAIRAGNDLTVVSWGSTVPLCAEAAGRLHADGYQIDLIDLRTVSPWDRELVFSSCRRTGRLLVVHEDNLTGGFGAEIVASVAETLGPCVLVRRVARADTFVPYNHQAQMQLLPQSDVIVAEALELLAVHTQEPAAGASPPGPVQPGGVFVMRAFRASPSDSTFLLQHLGVEVGDHVSEGDVLGEYETEKSVAEFASPVSGAIEQVFSRAGDELAIGAPILAIRTDSNDLGTAMPASDRRTASVGTSGRERTVCCSAVAVARGSRVVTNEELLSFHPGRTEYDIARVTGIESRCWIGEEEDAVALAVNASSLLLASAGGGISRRIGLVLVSTGSIDQVSPSIACRVVEHLAANGSCPPGVAALDISAACSGFLYGLGLAYDHVIADPGRIVLLITTETLSPLLKESDFATHVLFADAASAVLVGDVDILPSPSYNVHRPILRTKADATGALIVPAMATGQHLQMDGPRVFREAVRSMADIVRAACKEFAVGTGDLDHIIPHQANQRIQDAVARALGLAPSRLATNVRRTGNTSSSSIPLLLHDLDGSGSLQEGQRICLCSFGAGFTCAAAIVIRR